MAKNNLSNAAWKLRATGAPILALALSTFPAAFSRAVKAQTPAKATAQTPAKTTTSPASESKGGQKEGIKIHGHWTIEVRNPDGKLVTHREFENALDYNGAKALAEFLARVYTPGMWAISLHSGVSQMVIQEPGSDITTPSSSVLLFKTLTIRPPSLSSSSFVLSGYTTPLGQDAIYDVVATLNKRCIYTTNLSPAQCASNPSSGGPLSSENGITVFNLEAGSSTPPVSVSAGQIIQVTVTITFS
jgi:hypothetical protein